MHDNRKICSHAAECVNNLSSVFKLGSRPWINPDASKMNDIIDVVRRCPSGALSYSIDGVEYRDPKEQRNPTVTVLKNGPYHITGGIELIGEDIQFGEGASKEHLPSVVVVRQRINHSVTERIKAQSSMMDKKILTFFV